MNFDTIAGISDLFAFPVIMSAAETSRTASSRICLRVAAAEHGYSVGVQRFAVGNGLARLFYADTGDGAGIDYIHVGVGVFLRRGVPCGKECGVYRGALAGVHLTAQGDYTECHGYLFSHGLPIISTGVVRFRNFSQNQNFI